MILCYRGCGLEASHITGKGLNCCGKSAMCCPVVIKKAGANSGKARKGQPLSAARRKQISERLRQEWATETSKKRSKESLERRSETCKNTNALHPRDPWNKGKKGVQVPWNKGKHGYSIPPRRKISDEDYKEYQRYKKAVYSATRKTYAKNTSILNPNMVMMGRCGVSGAHQIDHIISISAGYKLKIPVHVMAIVENLQVISWQNNLKKSNKHTANEILLKLLCEYK